MSLVFRKFVFKDELIVQRQLFAECFPEHNESPILSEKHYLWKFHSKPGYLKSKEFVATDIHNNLLGYYAAIPYQYNINGFIAQAAMVCDVMTGLKARGKGVFTSLGIYSTDEFSKSGFDFSIGFPIRKEVIPGHIKAGWEINHELPLYGRFIKFNKFLKNNKLASPINFIYKLFISVYESIFQHGFKNIEIESYSSYQIDKIIGLDSFYEKWNDEITISLKKSTEFLKWRLGAPQTEYKILIIRHNKNIVGVLVAKEILREGVPCLAILDITILNGFYKLANVLINKLIQIGKENKIELVLIMISSIWYSKYRLFTNSFIKTPFKFSFIIKKFNNKIDNKILDNKNSWHLTWLDSDDL